MQSPKEFADRARWLIGVNRYSQADNEIREGLNKYPEDQTLLALKAEILCDQEHYELALEVIQQVLSKDPENFDARLILFDCYSGMKDYGQAEDVVLQLITDYPESGVLYAQYAYLMLKTLHTEKAEKLAAEAIKNDPEDDYVQTISLIVRVTLHNDEETQQALAKKFATDPESAHIALLIVYQLSMKCKNKEALRLAQTVYRAKPEDQELKQIIVELAAAAHPINMIYYPLNRWGWAASVVIWAGAIIGFRVMARFGQSNVVLIFMGIYLCWALSSWFVPKLIEKWIERRGI